MLCVLLGDGEIPKDANDTKRNMAVNRKGRVKRNQVNAFHVAI